MKCIVIDDEPLAREGMRLMIAEVPFLELCGEFPNVLQADAFLRTQKMDLIFLDIQMPKMTGMDYLRSRKNMPKVILTTAYPEHALEGFELEVVDYLVKPVRFERFYKAVNKALQFYYANFVQANRNEPEVNEDFVFVRSERKLVRLNYNDILYIEGLKDYVTIHCTDEKLIVAMNLKTIQSQLPESRFMRVNKSFIVNLAKIKALDHDFLRVGEEEIPVGDAYRDALLTFITSRGIMTK